MAKDININSSELREDIYNIVNENCKEIPWEGTDVDKTEITDSIISYIKENNITKGVSHY